MNRCMLRLRLKRRELLCIQLQITLQLHQKISSARYSVLQGVLQSVAVYCSVLQGVAVCCGVLQCVAEA